MQGDILEKSPELFEVINQAHQYYADAEHYTHFMVITQTCDLVRRRGAFNAPYITIAAVKPFSRSVQEFLTSKSRRIKGSEFEFQPVASLGKAKQMLERHLNNTEPEYFFIPSSGHPRIDDDLVVFLRLSIALRKDHYDILASSKIAELADVFQAKLGWLKGNIYSRVATPDLIDRGYDAERIKKDFYKKYIPESDLVWLSALQAEKLRKLVQSETREKERDLTFTEVLDLIEKHVPDDVTIIAENIVERLIKNDVIERGDEDKVRIARRSIANEPSVKSLVKGSQG